MFYIPLKFENISRLVKDFTGILLIYKYIQIYKFFQFKNEARN